VIRLKYERLRRGLPQSAFAIAAHIDQSDLAKIELGHYIPGRVVLGKLAHMLGLPADVLLKPISIAKPEHERPRDAAGRYTEVPRAGAVTR
jgi:transcriptional regulator with XRE-family HTH domain